MIDSLIQGRVVGQPVEKISKSGSKYAAFKMRVAQTGQDGTQGSLYVAGVAFDSDVVRKIMALADGEALAVCGELKCGVWMPPDGGAARLNLSVVATGVLSVYAVSKKRGAQQPHGQEGDPQRAHRDRGRPADEAWQAMSSTPASRVHRDYTGLDDGAPLGDF